MIAALIVGLIILGVGAVVAIWIWLDFLLHPRDRVRRKGGE